MKKYNNEDYLNAVNNVNTLKELKSKYPKIYGAIYRNGLVKKYLENFERKHKPNGFWSKNRCIETAKLYSCKYQLNKSEPSLCAIARERGWLNEVYSNIIINKWSELECSNIAKKYENKSEFRKNDSEIYYFSKESGFLDEICKIYNKKIIILEAERLIYSYTFFNKYVYVGITTNIKRRHSDHMLEGTVFKFIKENNIDKKTIKPVIEVSGIINAKLASMMEGIVLEEKEKNGFLKINKVKTGGLGGNQRKWDIKLITEEAKKYINRTSFAKNSSAAYSSAQRLGILDKVCINMKPKLSKSKNYWTKSRCSNLAKNFTNRISFCNYENSAYTKSLRCGWMNEFFPIVKEEFNKEYIKNIAIRFETRTKLAKSNPKIYKICLENNFLDEFIPISIKNEELCRNEVIGIKNRGELQKRKHTIYRLCIKLNLLDELFPLEKKRDLTSRNLYLDKENARLESLKYINRTDANKKNQIFYRVCEKFNWLDEFYPSKIKKEYCFEICKNDALQYSNRKEYAEKNRNSFKFASANNWVDIFFGKKKNNHN